MLIVFPVGATIYLVILTIGWVNTVFNSLLFGWIEYEIPGIGILAGFVLISMVGYVFTRAFTKPIVHFLEGLITKTPLVRIIYLSLKDLTEAFVGEKRNLTNQYEFSLVNTAWFDLASSRKKVWLILDWMQKWQSTALIHTIFQEIYISYQKSL